MATKNKPFITKKVAGYYMIQRGGKDHDGEWLTPDGKWDGSVIEAAGYKKKREAKEALRAL